MSEPKVFNIGDRVILDADSGDDNWVEPMRQFLGQVVTIKEIWRGFDGHTLHKGSYFYKTDSNGYWWRGNDLKLVGTVATVAPTAVAYGAKCSKCQDYNEYAPKSDTYVCYRCKH
jgi:hypothetical protein